MCMHVMMTIYDKRALNDESGFFWTWKIPRQTKQSRQKLIIILYQATEMVYFVNLYFWGI